jgi:tetratricopeptide (TPR) repeat protein
LKTTINDALTMGVEAHRQGDLSRAANLYSAILDSAPTHGDANHNLGIIKNKLESKSQAIPYLKAAIDSNPEVEQFWLSYINVLMADGQYINAIQKIGHGVIEGLSTQKASELMDIAIAEHKKENK